MLLRLRTFFSPEPGVVDHDAAAAEEPHAEDPVGGAGQVDVGVEEGGPEVGRRQAQAPDLHVPETHLVGVTKSGCWAET